MNLRIMAAIAVAVLAVSACSRSTDKAGAEAVASAPGQTVDVFSINLGDCLSDNAGGDETVTDMKKIDCAKPHDYEVFHTFELAKGAYPGEDVVDKAADAGCTPAFESFVGKSYDDSDLELQSLTPQEDGWKERDDREVVCLIVSADEEPLTGTMRGAKI